MNRKQKEQEILAVIGYQSGEGLMNTVYVGSMAKSTVIRLLGGKYGEDTVAYLAPKASDAQIDKAHECLENTINYMKKHPVTKCKCCGQIVSANTNGEVESALAAARELTEFLYCDRGTWGGLTRFKHNTEGRELLDKASKLNQALRKC